MEITGNVITRCPPSPTGKLHVGTVRMALFNYLFAKKFNGKMILRYEDTDKARSKKEFEQEIFEGLQWLGIKPSEVYHQSERTLVYKKYLEKLIADGKAYFSETSNISELNQGGEEDDEESGVAQAAPRVIRLKNQNKVITFNDAIRGDISVDTTELKDFIIARSIEEPLYHFAVVVDDFEMGITHILRGEDGIYNTPRQILIQEAIGAKRPEYCHLPFVLGSDKKKLSKRNGSASLNEYIEMGFLPEAIINYLALLGWNPGTDQEIFTFEALIKAFDFKGIQKSGAVFDIEKLRWINKEHLKLLVDIEFKKLVIDNLPKEFAQLPQWSDERLTKTLPDIRERITTLKEIKDLANEGDFVYFFQTPNLNLDLLIPRGKGGEKDKNKIKEYLSTAKVKLEGEPDTNWSKDAIKSCIWDFATEIGRGNVLWPMRVALSGREKSPDPFTLSTIIGKAETLSRLELAIKFLSSA